MGAGFLPLPYHQNFQIILLSVFHHLYGPHGAVGQGDAQNVQAGGDVGGGDRGCRGW